LWPFFSRDILSLTLSLFQELNLAGADANIYKLVGPVLIKQEKQEAVNQVNNRIEFINGEL
jgi:prefoldin beta subunit